MNQNDASLPLVLQEFIKILNKNGLIVGNIDPPYEKTFPVDYSLGYCPWFFTVFFKDQCVAYIDWYPNGTFIIDNSEPDSKKNFVAASAIQAAEYCLTLKVGKNMSTRGRIGILNENGSVESIYCHHDCYLSGAGAILIKNYTNESSVRELLALGDISSLYSSTDDCEAYARDRGEDLKDVSSRTDESVLSLLRNSEEYTYVFNPATKQWFWTSWSTKGAPLARLHEEDCK